MGHHAKPAYSTKYVAAIFAERINAAGRVKSPNRTSSPPANSTIPPMPAVEKRGGKACLVAGYPKIFCPPCCITIRAMTTRIRLRSQGDDFSQQEQNLLMARFYHIGLPADSQALCQTSALKTR
jgi:hypothetical protein